MLGGAAGSIFSVGGNIVHTCRAVVQETREGEFVGTSADGRRLQHVYQLEAVRERWPPCMRARLVR
jgi:hypothetical protein